MACRLDMSAPSRECDSAGVWQLQARRTPDSGNSTSEPRCGHGHQTRHQCDDDQGSATWLASLGESLGQPDLFSATSPTDLRERGGFTPEQTAALSLLTAGLSIRAIAGPPGRAATEPAGQGEDPLAPCSPEPPNGSTFRGGCGADDADGYGF